MPKAVRDLLSTEFKDNEPADIPVEEICGLAGETRKRLNSAIGYACKDDEKGNPLTTCKTDAA